jgi:class 3 adenylate cyclase/tetratricopeptide (TPR) repeat protein
VFRRTVPRENEALMRDGAASERSIITVLSVDMVDSTTHIAACDPDDAQAFFDRWFDHLSDAVERAGGLLVNFGGDGGLAVFGWPSALEDHADRACVAAWDIQHPTTISVGPDGTAVQFRVGVHAGLVGLRQLRREGRARFDTVGATVNIAAKLQQSAPSGAILVSADVAKLCRTALAVGAQAQLTNSSALNTAAFQLAARPDEALGNEAMRRYRSPIVGRREELDNLAKLLRRPSGGNASVALIGEAGIGKSRLAAAAIADAGDFNVLAFYGDPQKRTTPFAAARSLIGQLLHLHGPVSAERLQAALGDAGLDDDALSALEALLTTRRAPRRGKAELTQTQTARALANACCVLAANQPTLLLVEDLHAVDLESRQFLRLVARAKTTRPLRLLITGRPEALHDAREAATTIIRLEPLSRGEMEDLGLQLWPDGRPLAGLLGRMVDRADGVPFVLEELIRSVDTRETGAYQPLPRRVESVIHARLHTLSRSAKAAAQALSLLGEEVEVEVARAVLGCETAALLNALSELEHFAFVHPMAGHAIRLRHQIIAEACADTIPRERRKQIHRAAVEAIKARFPGLAGRYEQLAFHAEGSGQDAEALEYLWQAGLEAVLNSANASLNLIFDRALGVIERLGAPAEEKYVDLVLMAAGFLLPMGEFEKTKAHLPRATEMARRHQRRDKVCVAMAHYGMICWFEGRYEEGLRVTEEGLAMARALNSAPLIFAHQLTLANLLHETGQASRAIDVERELHDMLTGTLETARLGAPALPKSMTLSFLGWYMPEVGRYDEGIALAEQGLELAVREHDVYAEILARCAIGRNLQMLHRNADSVDCFRIARDLAETNGYDAIRAHLDGRLAIGLTRTDRAREAVSVVESCLKSRLHLRAGQAEVYCLQAGYAEALVGCGERERGLAALETALGIARGISNPRLMVDGLGLRARLLAELSPDDPQIAEDLRERQGLCERFGLPAWSVN